MNESLHIHGHLLEIQVSMWTGKEVVKYDGTLMSSRRNLLLFSTVHSFQVEEAEEAVIYEVQILGGIGQFGYAVRRNGIIQAHKP